MTEATHTPGPWVPKYWDRVTLPDDTDGSMSIAHVYARKGAPNEQTANQTLIAAAPDLLAALNDVVGMSSAFTNATSGQPYTHQSTVHVIDKARAAIAKATLSAGHTTTEGGA